MRTPVVAGSFYPSNSVELSDLIKDCFKSKFGSGTSIPQSNSIAVISPHAGYVYSGPAQSFVYNELSNTIPDTYVMLGLSHSGFNSSISIEDWKTPLGIVKNDTEFQQLLSKEIGIDESAHANEHSIEVQLPFLQHINKDKSFKIAPVIVSDDYEKVADNIHKVITTLNRKVKIIASSDFTHFGLNYGYFPFNNNIRENMRKLDMGAIKHIASLNARGFMEYIDATGATICGKYPIAAAIELSKKLGAKKASLLKYYTSGDIANVYSSAVGYAAIKIE